MSSKQQTSEDSTDISESHALMQLTSADIEPLGGEMFNRDHPQVTWTFPDDSLSKQTEYEGVTTLDRSGEGPTITVTKAHWLNIGGNDFLVVTAITTWPVHEGEQKSEVEITRLDPATLDGLREYDLL